MFRTEADEPEGGDAVELLATEEVRWPAAEFELELRKPVTLKDDTFTHLLLREPTMAEWEEIFAHPVATRRRKAVSIVAAVPMAAVALMGIGDVVRAENYLNAFFEVGQAIGGW